MNKVYMFETEEAVKYGVNGAIMLYNLKYWLNKNKANQKHIHEGRYWTYNSYKAYAKLFPFWSEKQVRTVLDNLIDKKILIKGSFNEAGYDNTNWYSINIDDYVAKPLEILTCPNGQTAQTVENTHLPKKADGLAQMGRPIPNNKTYSNYIYSIFEKWNSINAGIKHKDISKFEKSITNALHKYSEEEILIAIERLARVINNSNAKYNFKWNLGKFLSQNNGIENWLDEGQHYNNYKYLIDKPIDKDKPKKEATPKVDVNAILEKRRKQMLEE